MPRDSIAGLPGRAGLLLLVVGAALVWWGLQRAESRAKWLRVEAPHRAVADQSLRLRVHVAPLPEPARVCADLHWKPSRDESRGYLAGGGSKAVGREGGTFEFEIKVRPVAGLRFVTGIIFVSRTGNWRDHTLAAATEAIPVSSNALPAAELQMKSLRLQPIENVTSKHPRPAALPRWLTALLFLAAAVAAWTASRAAEGSTPAVDLRGWRIMAVLAVLACLCELCGLEAWLGARLRAMARAGDVYYLRVAVQRVVVSGIVAATILLLIVVWRARRSRRLLLAGLASYLAISLVNLSSLHVIDQVTDLSWRGLSLVQALKLTCAAVCLLGACSRCRALRSPG